MTQLADETPQCHTNQASKNGLFMGHYQAPPLLPHQHYTCAKCGEPCDTITTVVRKHDHDTTVYRKVDASSCCHGGMAIWDSNSRETLPCKQSLNMPPEEGMCLGHYRVPPLGDNQSYCCSQHGQDCEVLVIVEDNTLVRNKDDVVIRREYSLVDVASCCEADLEIRNLHNDDEVPCEMTLHAR